ncbi:SpoIIE family protein phosphatase [Desulforhopalus singaporensis]|uniref:Sigma-B regulation protein RsbU (Phosphoserine phosphatase) n=1 Tax=Desulforhopalus singaporensis TaxID=91360 RepID=A0A1H0QBX3_9BACT|nr:SpoIIE family protein phosphatase [Desulforhopalus singaporensis]SDP14873.1 sigma-B regulation protein RsbU (phosphoserine phosphatase) [Desulforhopalus singaporensis]
MEFQPKNLQQRTFIYILLPTFLLLAALSTSGFVFLRGVLLERWGENAIAGLQRAAHMIDMELSEPKKLLGLLQKSSPRETINEDVFEFIFKKLEQLEQVIDVHITWPGEPSPVVQSHRMGQMMSRAGEFRVRHYGVGEPVYDSRLSNRTVSLVSEFIDQNNKVLGRIEVTVAFDPLIEQVTNTPKLAKHKVYIIDQHDNVLGSGGPGFDLEDEYPNRVFGSLSKLENDTLEAIRRMPFGTVFGSGMPPREVSGFYHLAEAPWTMVIVAPGKEALGSIVRFRFFYIMAGVLSILFVLFFIRRILNSYTQRIKMVSDAATRLAGGGFGPPLAVSGRDEVGELTANFNTMSQQLQQRLAMKEAINVAREVQQNLLPHDLFECDGVSVSGVSLYCDETGGDYLDIIRCDDTPRQLSVVVGDVVGHGIGAALLMASVRAFLRCRVAQPGTPERIIGDVNGLICQDTDRTGSFVTLFFLHIDQEENMFHWVRAGHDPAIIYTPSTKKFVELKGKGLALGVDDQYRFECNHLPVSQTTQIILIGSDGAWEVENAEGEQFGKERIKKLLVQYSEWPAAEMLEMMVEKINEFRGTAPQRDDITLAVVKTG